MASVAVRRFGNFEQVYPVPQRYFLVKYELNKQLFREKILDASSPELVVEHRAQVQKAIED